MDAVLLELHLVVEVVCVHGLLLGAVGGCFALALAALLEADECEAEDEGETDGAADGVDGDFGAVGELVEFLGDGEGDRVWAFGECLLFCGVAAWKG